MILLSQQTVVPSTQFGETLSDGHENEFRIAQGDVNRSLFPRDSTSFLATSVAAGGNHGDGKDWLADVLGQESDLPVPPRTNSSTSDL